MTYAPFADSRAGSPQRAQTRCTLPSAVRVRRTRVGALHFSQTYCSTDRGIGDSFSMMPPVCWLDMLPDLLPCFVCRLTILMPSTVAVPSMRFTALTVPRLPFFLPRRTSTVSPLMMLVLIAMFLQHLRCERGDLQKAAVAQLAHDRPEDARPARIEVVLFAFDDDARVVVAAHDRTVRTADRRAGANDDGLDDLALLHGGAGNGAFDRSDDDVADVCVVMTAAARDVNHEQFARARVVGYFEPCLLLNHVTSRAPRSRPVSSACRGKADGTP